MTNNETNKVNGSSNSLIEQLKRITNDMDLDALGFDCLGKVDDIYPNLTEMYRIWIWENKEGYRIATFDLGNTHCKYACEGTKEAIKNLENQNNEA